MPHPLDNPIWSSLVPSRHRIAVGGEHARRYPPEIAPFAAMDLPTPEANNEALDMVHAGEQVGFLGTLPAGPGWELEKELALVQMIWERPPEPQSQDNEIVPLKESDLTAMLELTALVYPHYFRPGTAKLGDYFGIKRNGQLAAMAGIRFAFKGNQEFAGHQEISAVCTHPDFRGQGLASRLSKHLVRHIQAQGDVPFLHTEEDNVAARALYEQIGFSVRRMIPFQVLFRTT